MAKQLCFCNSEKLKKSYAYISPIGTLDIKQPNTISSPWYYLHQYPIGVINYVSSVIWNKNEKLFGNYYTDKTPKIATHRCSITYQNDEEREMMYDRYPKLEKHLKSIDRLNNDCFKENYLGCGRCVDINESYLFTYLANGWKNNINDQYENAQIINPPPEDANIED
jgi:hypothetical protein